MFDRPEETRWTQLVNPPTGKRSFPHTCSIYFLHTGGVEHNADSATDRLGREVPSELASDDAVGSVGAADTAPVDSVLGAIALGGALGDEGDALAEVEVDLLLGVDAGDLDEGGRVVLVAEAALVAEDGAAYVQSAGFGGHFWIM